MWCLELALPVPSGLAPEEQADLILRNGSISDANDAAASMMGAATGNDLVGLPLSGLIDDPRLRDAVIAFVEEGYRLGPCPLSVTSSHGASNVSVSLSGIVEREGLVRIWGMQRRRLGPGSPETLHHAQKMATIGQLAISSAGMSSFGAASISVAHDFNNLLAAIVGYSEIVQAGLDEGSGPRRDLEQVVGAARRAALLTRQLLAFSRQRPAEVFDLNAVLTEFEPLLRQLVREQVDIVLACSADPALIEIDRGQIELALVNLVMNARDAMSGGGRVVIGTSVEQGVTGRRVVELTVTDAGAGMSPEVQARIFEPYFTTKAHGLGLGLTTTQELVAENGGWLRCVSEPGRGATFVVTLDQAGGPDAADAAATITSISQFRSRHGRVR